MDSQANCSAQNPECLDAIIRTIKKNESCIKLQKTISAIGLIAILIVMVCFVLNIFNFATNYDTEAVGKELANRTTTLIQNPETQQLLKKAITDFQAKFVPAAKDAFSAKYQNAGPEFQAAIDKEIEALQQYLENEFRAELEKELAVLMDSFKADCTAKLTANGYDTETCAAAYQQFVEAFIIDITDTLEKHLGDAIASLNELQGDFDALAETHEYKTMEGMDCEDVANILAENLLIRCVYEVNPERGDKTFTNGEI